MVCSFLIIQLSKAPPHRAGQALTFSSTRPETEGCRSHHAPVQPAPTACEVACWIFHDFFSTNVEISTCDRYGKFVLIDHSVYQSVEENEVANRTLLA